MTEAEAKTKGCPMDRVGGNCIASGCMLWQWNEPVVKLARPETPKEAAMRMDASILESQGATAADGTQRYELCEPTGYCGLVCSE